MADALSLLDELDSLPAPSQSSTATGKPKVDGDAAEALAFFDEITQHQPEPVPAHAPRAPSAHLTPARPSSRTSLHAPVQRKSLEQSRAALAAAARNGSPAPAPPPPPPPPPATATAQAEQPATWGWGRAWSVAGAAIASAKTAVDEQVKALPAVAAQTDTARKWGEGMFEYVKSAQLDKISADIRSKGFATLTDILNVVAPPISEHEVIQVWLSHDMEGYEGIENLVYRALARIMEQVEGGDLVVNKGNESRPKSTDGARNLDAVDGLDAAFKLAQADVAELTRRKAAQPASPVAASVANPTTYSAVYLRVQPFYSHPAFGAEDGAGADTRQLQFLLHLADPGHALAHTTVTQAVPARWVPLWDDYEWVEDLVVEALRVGVEVVGQEYVVARMGWVGTKLDSAATAAAETVATEPTA